LSATNSSQLVGTVGRHVVEPLALCVLLEQGVHSVALGAGLEVLTGQGKHAPGPDTNEPGAQNSKHASADVEPAALIRLAPHDRHVPLGSGLYVLAGHCAQAVAPAVEPSGHTVQLSRETEPAGANERNGHAVQAETLSAALNALAAQRSHARVALEKKKPSAHCTTHRVALATATVCVGHGVQAVALVTLLIELPAHAEHTVPFTNVPAGQLMRQAAAEVEPCALT
jgi:hypothetical protein